MVFEAMAKAQAQMGSAKKDSNNPHFKSKYADLASVLEAAKKPFGDNGLALLQDVTRAPDGVLILTRIVHKSGEWVEFGPLAIPLTKVDAQGVGSAVSYGRRYAAQAALGQGSEDDDGNAVSQQPSAQANDAKKATENLKKKLGWNREQREQAEDHGVMPPTSDELTALFGGRK
jgi:ERF superfamily